MRLLLISNSTNAGEGYLKHAINEIGSFLGSERKKVLFVPYAVVMFSYDEYETRVKEKFREIGHDVVSVHHSSDPVEAVMNADALAIGGGNTWKLLDQLQKNNLIPAIREKVFKGFPYIGWSAGSNVACPTIMTTNDMPVVEPASFKAAGLVPFQINPHYLDANPEGHAGETREQRIMEFIEMNPLVYVVGLREGTMLRIEDNSVKLTGSKKARLFIKGALPVEAGSDDDLSFLLRKPS